MKTWVWFRVLAGIFVLFTLGHALGSMPHVTRGAQEATLFQAMQLYRFPIMGFTRSYWDFYRGFSLSISLDLATIAVLAWQVSVLSRSHPKAAVPIAALLWLNCLGGTVLACLFFFGGPIVMSMVAVACSTLALVALVRHAYGDPARAGSNVAVTV